jgi:hypothetical protein
MPSCMPPGSRLNPTLPPRLFLALSALMASWALAACSPVHNWREVRPDDSGLLAQFPCRPASHAREVALADQRVSMTMHACEAGGATYAVAWFDAPTPGHVGNALSALQAAAVRNTKGLDAATTQLQAVPLAVAGATPHQQAGAWRWAGRTPKDEQILIQFAAFARGQRVVQATVTRVETKPRKAAAIDAAAMNVHHESTQPFFAALRWPP